MVQQHTKEIRGTVIVYCFLVSFCKILHLWLALLIPQPALEAGSKESRIGNRSRGLPITRWQFLLLFSLSENQAAGGG